MSRSASRVYKPFSFQCSPFESLVGAFSLLTAIAAEMGQLQNLIQESRRVLNLFLRSVRTLEPDLKEARIRAARERIEDLA
ncbi:hypothetical protein Tco_0225424 [Tanacetum coccineum]